MNRTLEQGYDNFWTNQGTRFEKRKISSGPNAVTRRITARRTVTFGKVCLSCPLRAGCTTRKDGRSLVLPGHDAFLRAARRQAETPEFQSVYRQHRPMVERSIAWLVRGNRNVRYRGVGKNDHWLHHLVAAINLRRLIILGLALDGTGGALS